MGAYSSLPAHEGTRLEAILTWEQPGKPAPEMWRRPGGLGPATDQGRARRPRGGSHPPPGRPWGPVRTHYEGLPSMAGRGGDEGRRKPAGEARGDEPRVSISARKHGSRDTNRRKLERRMASAFARTRTAARRTLTKDAPFGAPAPHFFRRGARKRGPARGRHKNTGDGACPDSTTRMCSAFARPKPFYTRAQVGTRRTRRTEE